MKYDASSAIIVKDNKFFVGKRSLHKRMFPGLWEMIGGGIELGETPEQCMRREIQEELSSETASIKEFKDWNINGRNIKIFIVTLATEPMPNNNDFDDWGWFSAEEIKNLDFAVDCKERIIDYVNSLA